MKIKYLTEKQAKDLYKNKTVYMVGNKVNQPNYFGFWRLACFLNKNEDFERQVNSFYYYLDPELGNKVRFFILT